MIAIVAAVKLFQRWRVSFDAADVEDWFRPDLWREMRGWDWLLSLAVAPLLAYYMTFACMGADGLAPVSFIAAQARMWGAQSTLAGSHPYMSGWLEWPLLRRGVWYLFEGTNWDTSAATAQAVLYLGNPLVLWGGLIAVGHCAFGWTTDRRRDAFVIAASYGAFWLCWAVIPRHITFAFYYLPAATVLSLALAYSFYSNSLNRWPWLRRVFLLGSLAMFLYFLPVSNAAVRVSEPGFNASMWFNSWR
jgi:dolichyl-phosphate-mannose--protein O-mannosyl transferase